jgi:hypothetical protein
VHIDTDACDHSKQGLESEIPPEIQNDPESEVSDGCDPSKKALDKTDISHKNFDIDENETRTRTRDWYRKPTRTRIISYNGW